MGTCYICGDKEIKLPNQIKVSLSKIATQVIVHDIKPKVSVISKCDDGQKMILEYDIPPSLIKEFDDWRMRMEKLVNDDGSPVLAD